MRVLAQFDVRAFQASHCLDADAACRCFTDRKNAAVRAYHEWMPVRIRRTSLTLADIACAL